MNIMNVNNDIRLSWIKYIFSASSAYRLILKFKPLKKITYIGMIKKSEVITFHITAAFVSSLSMMKSTESPANLSKRVPNTIVIRTVLFICFKFKFYNNIIMYI